MSAVAITATGFSPQPTAIAVGDTVTWTNNDSVVHSVSFDAVTPDTPFSGGDIAAAGTLTLTFSAAGVFTYHDKYNPRMTGSVVVS